MSPLVLLATGMSGSTSGGSTGGTVALLAMLVLFTGALTFVKVKIRRRRLKRWEAQGIIPPGSSQR